MLQRVQLTGTRMRVLMDLPCGSTAVLWCDMPTPPESPDRGANLAPNDATPPRPPGSHRVEFDWRGETAYYVEHGRRVTLACMYWGGPKGSVAHIHGVWEYDDG